jgi:hypothetical protein
MSSGNATKGRKQVGNVLAGAIPRICRDGTACRLVVFPEDRWRCEHGSRDEDGGRTSKAVRELNKKRGSAWGEERSSVYDE